MTIVIKGKDATADSTAFRSWLAQVEFAATRAGFTIDDAKDLVADRTALLRLYNKGETADRALLKILDAD